MACTFHDWKEHLLPSSTGLRGWQPIWLFMAIDRMDKIATNCWRPSTIQFSTPVEFNTLPVEWRNFLALPAAILCCVYRGTNPMPANFSNPQERNVYHLHLPLPAFSDAGLSNKIEDTVSTTRTMRAASPPANTADILEATQGRRNRPGEQNHKHSSGSGHLVVLRDKWIFSMALLVW